MRFYQVMQMYYIFVSYDIYDLQIIFYLAKNNYS